MSKQRLTIIGPYPPPVGGIAVHVQRFRSILEPRFDIRVLDPYGHADRQVPSCVESLGPPSIRSAMALIRAARDSRPDLVHVHVAAMKRFALTGHFLTRALGRDVLRVLTIHSGSFAHDYRAGHALGRLAIRRITAAFDGVIAVNEEIAATVHGFGVPAGRLAVIPAYLPPPSPPAEAQVAALRTVAGPGSVVLITSGYGRREYGFEVLVNALASDRSLAARCALVICSYGDRDEGYMAEVEAAGRSLPFVRQLRDLTPEGFAAVLAAGDMYVRATTLDGDAMAIREAGAFGRQVLASDAVARPAGCLLFGTAQAGELADAIRQAIADRSLGKIRDDGRDGAMRILEFYDRIGVGRRFAGGLS